MNKYHGKWYYEDSWSNIIHQNFQIKTALDFTGKDCLTAIRKYKHFKHLIAEWSHNNQWGIFLLKYYHERKCVNIFQGALIGELPVEANFQKVE